MQKNLRPLIGTCVLFAAAASANAADEGFDPITPYRPTVSNPAQLPAPGQLEGEFGGLRTHSSDARRTSLPYLLKLAFTPEWGVLVGGEAHVWQKDADGRASSVGDTTLTAKRAWLVDEATAFGAELTATVPTADRRIGSGKADYTANGIFSRDLGPVHLDANLNATRVGAPDSGAGRARFGASASLSGSVSERWGLTGELSGTRERGAEHGAQLLAAVTYSPSKQLTFDVGVARAWRPAPASNAVFVGVVVPIAKLW